MATRLRLRIAGWDQGGYRGASIEQAANLPKTAEVEFRGALHGQDKHAAYCQADAFILPSYSEGQPIAMLEAWSYNTPTFITDECNLPEAFAADAAVRITTNPEELARVLQEKLEDPALEAKALRARRLCEEKFTCERVADQYLATYRWLLGQGDQPDFVSTGS